jgi:hypothetical protein
VVVVIGNVMVLPAVLYETLMMLVRSLVMLLLLLLVMVNK